MSQLGSKQVGWALPVLLKWVGKLFPLLASAILAALSACSSLTDARVDRYQLTAFAQVHPSQMSAHASILVNQPTAMLGYDTDKMLYQTHPYQLFAFAHHRWLSPPAQMLLPLVTQSLKSSHYFSAVIASPAIVNTTYRLDIQLWSLEQNFLVKPSQEKLLMYATLVQVSDNRVMAEKTFSILVPCPTDTPYGGVMAANQATLALTRQLTNFVVHNVGATGGRSFN